MKRNFMKQRHNPIDLIKEFWPGASVDHITYDPDMKNGEYDIIRQSGGDGTVMFTMEMLQKGLIGIANANSYYRLTEPEDWSKVKQIKYTVGPMRHVTVFGMIYLACSKDRKYPGQRERIRMPVKCEYIYS